MFSIQPPHPWRDAAATATQIHNIAVVSGEKFVASIPRKCNRHVLACQFRNIVRWDYRRIAERLFHHVRQHFQSFGDVGFDHQLMMICCEALGDRPRMLCFVVIIFAKSDRKGLYWAGTYPRHQAHHNRRVHAATEQRPEGNITDQPDTHRFLKPALQFFQALFFRSGIVIAVRRDVPILPYVNFTIFIFGKMARRQLGYLLKCGIWIGNVGEIEELQQAFRVDLSQFWRNREQGLDFGSEQ